MSRPGGPPPDFNWDAMGQASRLEQDNAKLRMALEQREREVDSLRCVRGSCSEHPKCLLPCFYRSSTATEVVHASRATNQNHASRAHSKGQQHPDDCRVVTNLQRVHGRSLAEVAAPMSTGDIIAADVKASRIAELVKQNKAVNLALEREKVPSILRRPRVPLVLELG